MPRPSKPIPAPRIAAETNNLPTAPGAYALIIDLGRRLDLPISKKTPWRLDKGRYLYAGSARGPGGIGSRVRRHLRPDKALHWHVDYLTAAGTIAAAAAFPGGTECRIIDEVLLTAGVITPLAGFGSSDCRRCRSHLVGLPPQTDPLSLFGWAGENALLWFP